MSVRTANGVEEGLGFHMDGRVHSSGGHPQGQNQGLATAAQAGAGRPEVPEPLSGVGCCSEQVVQGLRAEIQEDAVMPQHSSPGLRFPGTGEASAPFLGPRLSGLNCKCWSFLWPLAQPLFKTSILTWNNNKIKSYFCLG